MVVGTVVTLASIASTAAVVNELQKSTTQSAAAEDTAATEAAPAPSAGAGTDANSFDITVSEGNTVKVTVVDSLYVAEIPTMSYMKPNNGGFLLVEVSWETLTGTSFPNPANFEAYDADGKEGEGIYLETGGLQAEWTARRDRSTAASLRSTSRMDRPPSTSATTSATRQPPSP